MYNVITTWCYDVRQLIIVGLVITPTPAARVMNNYACVELTTKVREP